MPETQEFVDKVEAAQALRMHPHSLLRAIREGTLPLRPYPRPDRGTHLKYFFRRADVERLARQRRLA